jgi:pilus assembly protein Flp/PilA
VSDNLLRLKPRDKESGEESSAKPPLQELIEIRVQGVFKYSIKQGGITMVELIKRFIEQEEGQDLVEYALLLVFIALIVIAALPNLGKTVSNVFSNATSVLQSGS